MRDGFSANTLSLAAREACRRRRFGPRRWEPINANLPATWAPGEPEIEVMRLWNMRRTITLTNRELAEAMEYRR